MPPVAQPLPTDNDHGGTPAAVLPRRRWIRRASPFAAHLLTAVAAVLMSVLIIRPLPTTSLPAPTAAVRVTPVVLPTPQPTAALPISDTAQLQLDLRSLQSDRDQLWSAVYLLRAAVLLDDAAAALVLSDRSEADRALLAARQALDRAYQVSLEPLRDPIDQLRLQIALLRDDLDLRPEGADRRLRQLRRLVISLVDEG
jgi:hypothetical protein